MGKKEGTYCVGLGLIPIIMPLKHHILSCPSGNWTACPHGYDCDPSATGLPQGQAECQAL